MKQFKMSKDLYTYVDRIDNQHSKLIRLANELSESVGNVDQKEIQDRLNFLGRYVGEHFSFEESLQQESGYPDFEKHHQEHEDFLEDWVDMKIRFAIGESNVEEIRKEIDDKVIAWVVNHIYNSDKVFAEHYRKWSNKERNH